MFRKIIRSLLSGFTGCLIILLSSYAYRNDEPIHQLAERTQLKLNTFHNPEAEFLKIKKCELLLSDEGFLRYRRTYISGKQEYYSFNLTRVRSIDYLGDILSGELSIQTQEDDVIVQTYNDRGGDVDSMATHFRLALHNIDPKDLAALHDDLFEMKRLLTRN